MPKVLSSPKLPIGKGTGRRSFRLSPLEIGVAILVAMGAVYLIYVLLNGLFGGGAEAPAPAGGPVSQGINPARLDKVLSAAEAANSRIQALEKRVGQMDKRLQQGGGQGGAPASGGEGDAKLAARVDALEKKLAALPAAPAGEGKAAGDPKLIARVDNLEKTLASLGQQYQQAAKEVEADQSKQAAGLDQLRQTVTALEKQNQALAKDMEKQAASDKGDAELAPKVAGLEKSVAALDKQNQALVKDMQKQAASAQGEEKLAARVAALEKQLKAQGKGEPAPAKLQERLGSLEKQVQDLAKRPAAQGQGQAPVSPALTQRVTSQGMVLSGLTATMGRLQRSQERLEKQVGALAVAAPAAQGAPLASPLLAQRLDGLEKQITDLSKAQAQPSRQALQSDKRLDGLEKQITALSKAQAKPSRQELQADKRLDALEKQITDLSKAQAKPSRQELQADKRLDALEKELARLKKQPAAVDPGLNARLRSLEKQLVADNRDEQVMDRRLDQLEKQVSGVAAQVKTRPAPAPRPAPVARPAPAPEPKPVRIEHVVRPGQTLYGLARGYGVTIAQIREWNPKLKSRDKLYIGEKLVIVVRK